MIEELKEVSSTGSEVRPERGKSARCEKTLLSFVMNTMKPSRMT